MGSTSGDGLNDKQLRFCQEYVIDLNGTQAAIRAGYSRKTANEQSARLLANVSIQQRVNELQKAISERTEITADSVVRELAKLGFSNIQDFIEDSNEITDISQVPREKAAAVESVKKTKTTAKDGSYTTESVQIRLNSKQAALESLGKHLGIFREDNQQKQIIIPPAINLYGEPPQD